VLLISQRRRATLAALPVMSAAMLAAGTPLAPTRAASARTIRLEETANLHLTSKRGFTLNEQGVASGTIRGRIYIHLHLLSNSKVTSEVNIYPHGGFLSGRGSAGYRVVGSYASFSGYLSVTRGTGSYEGARASGLRFQGRIQRRNDTVAVKLSGSLSL